MRLIAIILTSVLLCVAPQAMSIELPPSIQQYLQTGSITEDGELSGSDAEQTAFINYVKTNWSGMLDTIESIAPQAHQQRLIVAAGEYLPGRDYLQFMTKLCDRKAAGKVTALAFESSIGALTPKKKGFLAWNYQDPQVRQLLQRFQALLSPDSNIQPGLAKKLSGAGVGAAETATLGQGLPAPETLAPH